MTQIKKVYEQDRYEPTPEPTVDNKLELLKHLGEVESPIKENITSDFVYAKLGDKDREGIIEMTANAQTATNFFRYIINNTEEWTYNQKTQEWNKETINKEKEKKVKENAKILYNNFMIRPYMTSILHRNVKNNYLIRLLAGANEEEPIEQEEEKTETTKEKILNALKSKEEKN